ncbi:MAG: DUF2971 domain-containing protein [Cyclobacteriaceae bacterium]|nr:DUF2971 domain-containing protein [Cyclobacteriaceae bacterium]
MNLVKFCACEFGIENLEKGQLYFNSLSNLNDPFEGIFRYRPSTNQDEFERFYRMYFGDNEKLDYYFQNKHEFYRKINETLEWRYSNNGICCFSDETCINDIRMWSHYADKQKGFCLRFNETLNFSTPRELNEPDKLVGHPSGPFKVEYTDEYINEDPTAKKLNQRTFLTTKFVDWSHEKEYRFISPIPGPYLFEKQSLIEVVFGLNFDYTQLATIKATIQSTYPALRFRCQVRVGGRFELTSIGLD